MNEGDRLRCLPRFPLPFKKYDKSRDAEIPCLFCGKRNPVVNDSRTFCRNPAICWMSQARMVSSMAARSAR